ncbi:type II secretion system F family protein [Alteribacillus iranensis]|uniref:Tight adherence protein B n=1 Tax=Alteribacillus iranensis TaxID=930128 RepID=A0A1I2EVP1_9BACI|nr:type II secretion system F family protein [Alteribacillus iranensis]SFE96528.1 tight adherence protein B [Alteribacillus iranensis]
MKVLLALSIFITLFLIVLSIDAMVYKSNEDTKMKRSTFPTFTFKDIIKNYNEKLKLLLIRNRKPSKRNDQLNQQIAQAGLPIKPEEFVVFQLFSLLIMAGIFYLVFQRVGAAIIGAVIGYIIPKIWLQRKRNKRIQQFNDMLPDMLITITGSLRAGYSFPQALKMVSEESYSPIKEEVELVLKEMQYGSSMEDALRAWKDRMPSEDLELLTEAILIQRQVGGNLAYLLDKIIETTREREKIANQVKTLTAQGRLSGIIISLLPIGLGIVIYLMNPEYISTLFTHPIGRFMIIAAGMGAILGFVFIRKITTIEV